MRVPSNRMPARDDQSWGLVAWVMITLLYAVLIPIAFVWFVFGGGFVILLDHRRTKRLVKQRQGESICTFARSLDCRHIDTWIIRGVYEEIQSWVNYPIRASDRFDELGIDAEDIDDIAEIVARRTSRTLDGCEQNPWYGRVYTLYDLVGFFTNQPLIATA